jgi:hypothetical protein
MEQGKNIMTICTFSNINIKKMKSESVKRAQRALDALHKEAQPRTVSCTTLMPKQAKNGPSLLNPPSSVCTTLQPSYWPMDEHWFVAL